jgi:CHASE2 domain-containing sensor protein
MSGCIFALWYRPQLLDWRYWGWYDWVFMGLLVGVTTVFGKSESYMMVLVCLLVAGVYVAETQQWRPVEVILAMSISAWCIVQLQTLRMPSSQVGDFQRHFVDRHGIATCPK